MAQVNVGDTWINTETGIEYFWNGEQWEVKNPALEYITVSDETGSEDDKKIIDLGSSSKKVTFLDGQGSVGIEDMESSAGTWQAFMMSTLLEYMLLKSPQFIILEAHPDSSNSVGGSVTVSKDYVSLDINNGTTGAQVRLTPGRVDITAPSGLYVNGTKIA